MSTIEMNAPLISFDKKLGNWSGEQMVLGSVNRISSKLGILDYELHHKVLKEYNRNRDIYDMDHNHTRLLRSRIVGLALDCYKKGTPDVNWLSSEMVNLHLSFSNDTIKYFHLEYPVFPVDYYQVIYNTLIERVAGMVDIGDNKRADFNLEDFIVKPIVSRHLALFYMNWEKYSDKPNLWANAVIKSLYDLSYGKNHSIAKAFIDQTVRKLEDDLMLSVSPLRKEVRIKAFIYKMANTFLK